MAFIAFVRIAETQKQNRRKLYITKILGGDNLWEIGKNQIRMDSAIVRSRKNG